MAGQVTRGSLSMAPSRPASASPQTAAIAVTMISNSAVWPSSGAPSRAGGSAASPHAYPIRQNTRASWPTKWLPGGATSMARPAQNPISEPASGPLARPSAATVSSTTSGPVPPGKAIRSTMVSWTMTANATAAMEISPRSISRRPLTRTGWPKAAWLPRPKRARPGWG